MQRRHRVKEHRVDKLHTRLKELRSDHQRHGATDHKHDQGGHHVERADILVISGRHPSHQALGRTVVMVIVMNGRN